MISPNIVIAIGLGAFFTGMFVGGVLGAMIMAYKVVRLLRERNEGL